MKLWTVVAAVLLATGATTVAAQEIKIGYVDLQRALNESKAGQKARESFKKDVDKYQSGLKKQKEDLETLREQLEKKSLVMKEDERRSVELDYQRRARDFERAYKDSQGELQLKDNQLTAEILKGISQVVQEYGKQEGYTLILENSSSTVLYSAQDADLTERIIQVYDERKK
jgi:outer membrane protein